MEVVRGQIVQSRRGRDVTCWYAVVGEEGAGSARRLLLANGQRRTLAVPKRKNPLHLQPTRTVLPQDAMQTDQKLRAALKDYVNGLGQQKGG